jgi:murein L,D-transpeptidase YcbB/YkuD
VRWNVEGIIVTPNQEQRASKSHRITISILAIAAVAGWGACTYAVLGSTQLEKQLSGQSAALLDYQAKFLSQRKTVEDGEREIANLREQLSIARTEIEQQSARYLETEAELAKAKERLALVQPILEPQAVGSAPDLLRITPLPTKQDVMAAQEALTKLRFGALEADGVLGTSTREAIKEFQQAAGLPVTGELQPQTLMALTRAAKIIAVQNEKLQRPL